MIHQIDIPDNVIPLDKIPTAFRRAKHGEWYLNETGELIQSCGDSCWCYLILEPVKKLRPLTIKEACEAMCQRQQFGCTTITAVHYPGSIVYDGRCMNLKAACDKYQVGVME